MGTWQVVLLEPARLALSQISQFVVNLLLVLVILVIGLIISKLIRTAVTNLLRAVKLDDLSDRLEIEQALAKGGIKYSLSELIGLSCYWLMILVTVIIALGTVNLISSILLDRIVGYIPNIIAAIFILIVGMFVSTVLKNVVATSTSNVGLTQSSFLSRVAEVLVVVFTVVMALEQIKIGVGITQLTLGIILGSLGLAFALAFGLGCKDLAAKYTAEFLERFKK